MTFSGYLLRAGLAIDAVVLAFAIRRDMQLAPRPTLMPQLLRESQSSVPIFDGWFEAIFFAVMLAAIVFYLSYRLAQIRLPAYPEIAFGSSFEDLQSERERIGAIRWRRFAWAFALIAAAVAAVAVWQLPGSRFLATLWLWLCLQAAYMLDAMEIPQHSILTYSDQVFEYSERRMVLMSALAGVVVWLGSDSNLWGVVAAFLSAWFGIIRCSAYKALAGVDRDICRLDKRLCALEEKAVTNMDPMSRKMDALEKELTNLREQVAAQSSGRSRAAGGS